MRNLFSGGKKFITIPLTILLFVVFAFASPSSNSQKTTPSENAQPIEETNQILPATDEQSNVSPVPTNKQRPTETETPTKSIVLTPTQVLLPTKTPTAIPTQTTIPKSNGNSYTCDCSKTCEQISSCSEAQYQLHSCGCSRRDADHDGIACDAAPLRCQN